MIKKLILLFSGILFFITDSEAQTPRDNACEAEVFCSTVRLDNFANKIQLPLKAKYLFPKGFCGGSVDGPSWFKFIAESTTLDLRFNYSMCGSSGQTGFQAAIFSTTNCADSAAFILKSNCLNLGSSVTSGTLNATGLVNGQTYYIFIDGLSGSQCDYNIDVVAGTIQTVSLSNLGAPTVIYGPTEICNQSASAVFSVPKNASASSYNITVEINGGPPLGGSQPDSFYRVLAAFTPVGIARVTANYVNNCSSGPTQMRDVVIGNVTNILLPPINLSFGQSLMKYDTTFDYGPTPLGTTSSQSVSFARQDLTFGSCDTIYNVMVNRLAQVVAGKVYFLRPNESITLGGTTYTVTANNCTPIITPANDTIYNAVQAYTLSPSTSVTLNCNSVTLSVSKTDSCANMRHFKTYTWNAVDNGVFTALGLAGPTNNFNSTAFDSLSIVIKDSVLVNGKPESGFKVYYDTLRVRIAGVGSADMPPRPVTISGSFSTCQNDIVTYKLPTRTPYATSYTWSIVRGGGTILSGQGDTAITVKWGSLANRDTIKVVATNVCHTSPVRDLFITIGTFPSINAGADDSLCGFTTSLRGISSGNVGNWTSVLGNPSIPAFQNSTSPTTSVAVTTAGTYKFAWTEMNGSCRVSDTVSLVFSPMAQVAGGSLKDSCSATRSQAFVRFNITGGTSPYKVYNSATNVLAGTVSAGGLFQSTAFTPGNYSFQIRDARNCTPPLIQGTQACTSCNTNAGVMQAGNFTICERDSARATYLNGSILEPDDTLQFVLHTGDPKTGILVRSFTPKFAFQTGMSYGTTYYISAIAGNKIGTNVDLNDGCFSTTTARIVSVVFNKKPTAIMTVVDSNLCLGSCANVRFTLTGQAPFTITSKISNPTTKDTVINTSLTSYDFSYCPTVNSALRLFSIRDASGCLDSVSVNKTVNFTIFTPVKAGLDTALTVCQGVDTTLNLDNLLRGGNLSGTWSEISTQPSTGGAFNATTKTFRTRSQGNRVYKFNYIVRPTVITSPCPPDTATISVTIQFTPKADAGTDDIITCARPIVLIGGNTQLGTGISLQWSSIGNNLGGNAPQQEVSQADSYILTASAGGCFSRDTVIITADTLSPRAVILPVVDSITCRRDTLTIDGTRSSPAGIVYLWSYNGAPYDNNPTSIARFGGTYMLTVAKLTNGCVSTDSLVIKENRLLPTVFIEPTPKINCEDTLITLSAISSSMGSNYQIKWTSSQGGHFKSDSTGYEPKVDSAGVYTLVITDRQNGCKDSVQRTVIGEFDVPVAQAFTLDSLDCYHPTVNISARGSSLGVGLSYLWIANPGQIVSGDSTLNAVVSEPGLYYFIATNDKTKCVAVDSVEVFRNDNRPENIDLTVNKPTCYGEQNGSMVINSIAGGTAPYLYSLDGKVYTPRKTFNNLTAGAYKLYVQDASGCVVDTAFNMIQDRQIGVSIGLDTLLKLGDSILLQVGVNIPNIKRVIWSSYTDSTCRRDSACMQQWVKPVRQTTYNVKVLDTNGCTAEGSIHIRIDKTRPIFIPDMFSPNNDGTNDIFMIHGSRVVKIVKRFQVFDRWGELLSNFIDFGTDNPAFGWDGRVKGKEALPGVYTYYAEIEYLDGQIDLVKGDVTLIR